MNPSADEIPMTTLTPQDIAEVAREVTRKPFGWHQPGPGYPYVRSAIENRLDDVWMPAFHDNELQRSQALALVEWLIARIWELYESVDSYNQDWLLDRLAAVSHGINDKDTPALMRLVLELKGGKAG